MSELIDDFNEYVDNFLKSDKLEQMIVKKYSITDNVDFIDYDIYDADDTLFIIREIGVMQYNVFFDRFTVNM